MHRLHGCKAGIADEFKEIERDLDVIKLMKASKGLSYHIKGEKYHPEALHQAMKSFYLFNQNKEMTNAKFLEAFQTLVSVITECGGEIGHNPVGIMTALKEKGGGLTSATTKELEEAKATAKERYLTVAMISACDKSRYSKLSEDLDNDYTKGSIHYPRTIMEAYNLIVNYRQSKPSGRVFNDSEGIAFTNVESTRQAHPRAPDIATVKCNNCNKKGHYSSDCPEKETEKDKEMTDGLTATMMVEEDDANDYDKWDGFTFHQSSRKVNPAWILLDNYFTTDTFCNSKPLQ
jgi:hypothetical protein